MPFLFHTKPSHQDGFTLVEMLIIAPIIVLVLGTFVGAMISMVGNTLAFRDKDGAMYNVQNALSTIESDTKASNAFLSSTGTLPTPQGSDGAQAAFTTSSTSNANTLILQSPATSTNPLNVSHSLIYETYQPNACGDPGDFTNTPFTIDTVYFLSGTTLWRRTIVPSYSVNTTGASSGSPINVCSAPWQQNSCTPPITASPTCQTTDTQIATNVSNFSVSFDTINDNTPAGGGTPYSAASSISNANAINVSLTISQTTAGRSETYTNSMFIPTLNGGV